MNDSFEQEESLRRQVEDFEEVLQARQADLHRANAEIEALAERKYRYAVLHRICDSVEELADLGASELFWGDRSGEQASRLAHARAEMAAFEQEITAAEVHRQEILQDLGEGNDDLDSLYLELREVMAENESRRHEWLVEREPDPPGGIVIMPWSRDCEEDLRARRLVGSSVLASVVLALLVASITLPVVEKRTIDELPDRVAKLVRRPPPPPPAEPVPPAPAEKPPEEKEVVKKEPPPEKLPEAAEAQEVASSPVPDPKQQIRSRGILAFRDNIKGAARETSARLGANARISNAGSQAVGRPERNMVATAAPGSSGGINLADISRDVGGGGAAMEGVEVARVASAIGGAEGVDRPRSAGANAGRTDEEIQIVFDRYKSALYRLYNRELRNDPTLRGQLVLKLTIEPDGSVSTCELASSNMESPALAQQVVDRVSNFDFGAKDVAAVTIIYPIDFLPAA